MLHTVWDLLEDEDGRDWIADIDWTATVALILRFTVLDPTTTKAR